jgi:hypothetical protein
MPCGRTSYGDGTSGSGSSAAAAVPAGAAPGAGAEEQAAAATHATATAINTSLEVTGAQSNPDTGPADGGLRGAVERGIQERFKTNQEVPMTFRSFAIPAAFALAMSTFVAATPQSQSTQKPQIQVPIPSPGVPQIMTLEDQYVRVAYNNEGYGILGYRAANEFVGKDWLLLEVGATLRENQPTYVLKRSAITVSTPDGKTVPMPTNAEYQQVDLRAMEQQANSINDPVGYFPPTVKGTCRLSFFAQPTGGARAFDEVELTSSRGCVGRLFFKIPGGLQYGQHFLNIQFAGSLVRVPFRIFTKEEAKILQKNWKDIKKQVDEAFKKGGGGL